MKLKDIAAKPKLTKVTVDSEIIMNAYGEELEFYMYDRQDIPTFMKLSQLKENPAELMALVRDIVLDENGKKVLDPEELLPFEILVEVIRTVVERLGNTSPRTIQS